MPKASLKCCNLTLLSPMHPLLYRWLLVGKAGARQASEGQTSDVLGTHSATVGLLQLHLPMGYSAIVKHAQQDSYASVVLCTKSNPYHFISAVSASKLCDHT